MGLGDALASFRTRHLKDMTDWPHEGRMATLEVLRSVYGLAVKPTTHHDLWQQRSGVHSAEAAVCWEPVSDPGARLAVRSPRCTIVSTACNW